MAPTLHSPVPDFTGAGPGGTWFEGGRAETDDPAVLAYARRRGYGVDEEAPEVPEPPAPVDPRTVQVEQVGAPLRDAAADPHPNDHLPLTEPEPRKPSTRKRPSAKE
ncbi:hypothetical protein ACQZM9_21765 [Streptomyces sp. P11-1]|uniref:hypothetical protein n=1 Tax=Streptomyces sp. P11-1 TaxID=3423221 RepID=UPI003D2F1831